MALLKIFSKNHEFFRKIFAKHDFKRVSKGKRVLQNAFKILCQKHEFLSSFQGQTQIKYRFGNFGPEG